MAFCKPEILQNVETVHPHRYVTVNTVCRCYRDSQLMMLFDAVVAVYCDSHKMHCAGKAWNCCVSPDGTRWFKYDRD